MAIRYDITLIPQVRATLQCILPLPNRNIEKASLLANFIWAIWKLVSAQILDRYLVDTLPMLGLYLADTRPILGLHLTASWPAVDRYISADASADSRPTVGGTIGRPSVEYQALYRSTVGRQSVDSRSTVGRLSTDIAVDIAVDKAADISTEATYEGLNGVNRQPSNGQKINRQPSKTGYFYRQPSNERAKISRQTSRISLNDRDRLT